MKEKNKYYVVWEGKTRGIFSSWEKCKTSVDGFPNAKFKGFPTKELAEKAFSENYQKFFTKKEESLDYQQFINKEIKVPSIAVDAACSGNPGVMEYKGVDVISKKEIFRMSPMEGGTNNIGEFLAIVHALALLKKNNLNYPIYSDSKIAIGWIFSKKCKTNISPNKVNQQIFDLINRAENWLKENSFSNQILKWDTKTWGEIPADFGRKN